MLRADGQADGVRPDALIEQLLRRELGMRRRGRVDDEALDVRDVGQQGEDLQVVDEAVRLGLAARDLKGEDGAAAVREVLLIQRVVRVARQRRMVDAGAPPATRRSSSCSPRGGRGAARASRCPAAAGRR